MRTPPNLRFGRTWRKFKRYIRKNIRKYYKVYFILYRPYV